VEEKMDTGQHWHVLEEMGGIGRAQHLGRRTKLDGVAVKAEKHLKKNTKKTMEKQVEGEGEIRKGERGRREKIS
jgi:hypothetical protein